MRFGRAVGIRQTPTINTVQYSANDNVGGLMTVDAIGPAFGTGVLKHITITDFDNQKAALTILFFESLPAGTFTNNSAFPNLATADLDKVIGKVEIAADDYTTFNARAVATVECSMNVWSRQQTAGPSEGQDKRTIYYAIQTSGTPTYTAADSLKVKLGLLVD